MRFDDTSSPATRVKYLTDGMLLREALLDPTLSHYKARRSFLCIFLCSTFHVCLLGLLGCSARMIQFLAFSCSSCTFPRVGTQCEACHGAVFRTCVEHHAHHSLKYAFPHPTHIWTSHIIKPATKHVVLTAATRS